VRHEEVFMARVLVVDDSAAVRGVARAFLERQGHEVAEAGDGAEAVRAFCAQEADLILCDVFMPGKDGLQTIRELRALRPDVKVVAMSGGGRKIGVDLLGVARAFGAAATLPKPFDAAAVAGAVRQALDAPGPT
jgi:CheY-like chemotaxis protein